MQREELKSMKWEKNFTEGGQMLEQRGWAASNLGEPQNLHGKGSKIPDLVQIEQI